MSVKTKAVEAGEGNGGSGVGRQSQCLVSITQRLNVEYGLSSKGQV